MTSRAAGQPRDIVVIGGSAGAMQSLSEILAYVSRDLRSIVIAVIHMSAHYDSHLAELLGAQSKLPVVAASHGLALRPGHVYVSVPDYHLLVDGHQLHLGRGPKEHFTRPAIDVLFRSAADQYGSRVAGVLLSGGGIDGTLGLIAIKTAGGIALAQDPKTTVNPGLLSSAIDRVPVDAVLTVPDIARALVRLASGEPLARIEP